VLQVRIIREGGELRGGGDVPLKARQAYDWRFRQFGMAVGFTLDDERPMNNPSPLVRLIINRGYP
jgi:hypothetical protein